MMNAKVITKWQDFGLGLPCDPKDWNGSDFVLLTPLAWSVFGVAFCIPASFRTDGKSVPRLYRWRFGKWGKGLMAAIIHDWIYRTPTVNITRLQADMIFREIMKQNGVGRWNRNVQYRAVRMGGAGSYKERTK